MSDYFSSANDPAAVAQIAARYGFCLVKNLFTPAEMEQLEVDLAEAARSCGGAFPDLYACPTLRWVMLDGRIREIAKALVGDTLVYYRESAIVFEDKPGPATLKPFREFHCDARGTAESLLACCNPSADEIYGAYRFAIYFRNYRDFSGGLTVGVGTHRLPWELVRPFNAPDGFARAPAIPHWFGSLAIDVQVPPFEVYHLPSTPGDVVIFNLRCFHAAGSVRIANRPNFATVPVLEEAIRATAPQICLPTPPGCRNVIFFDFGTPSEQTDLYARWRGLVEPLDGETDPAFDEPAESNIVVRNDKLIVGLAEKLNREIQDQSQTLGRVVTRADLSASIRGDFDRLVRLCRGYRAYSPHHPLFDQTQFEQRCGADPLSAAIGVVQDVIARKNALLQEEQRALN